MDLVIICAICFLVLLLLVILFIKVPKFRALLYSIFFGAASVVIILEAVYSWGHRHPEIVVMIPFFGISVWQFLKNIKKLRS
jgi:hypothetical protein